MKKILKFVLILNYILAVVTLLSYLSPFANPKVLWPISVVAVFYPWLLLANIAFVIFWMVYKLRFTLISIVTILIGAFHFNSFLGFSADGYQSSPDQIEVLSYNTQNMHYVYKNKDNRSDRIGNFFAFLKKFQDLDIICTQEMGIRSVELWNNKLNWPHHFAPEEVGPVIFSKHPITDKGQIHSSSSTINSCIWTDINIKGNTFRIYNLHMQSNQITRTAERVMEEVNIQNKETWSGVKSIIKRYKNNAAVRVEHADRIREHMLQSPYPIILAGDFNDVPQSYLYHKLATGLKDSFAEQGSGFGTTFAGKIPALRIDYILADDHFEILNHKIIKEDFSDHYPVKSILKLENKD